MLYTFAELTSLALNSKLYNFLNSNQNATKFFFSIKSTKLWKKIKREILASVPA